MKQKKLFLESEGNKWYQRNIKGKSHADIIEKDLIIKIVKTLNIKPKRVLEIGCSNGYRLEGMRNLFECECFGIEPSVEAVNEGQILYPMITINQGTSDVIDFTESFFDVVILGFFLYLCDREDLFKIACEVDRVLSDEGCIFILDFNTSFPYKNKYKHCEGVYSYKMDYARMFNWNPIYSIIFHQSFSHGYEYKFNNIDDRIAITVLHKNINQSYPDNPFKAEF